MAEIRYNIKTNELENVLPENSEDRVFDFNFINLSDTIENGSKTFILKVQLTDSKKEKLGINSPVELTEKALVFSWEAQKIETIPIHSIMTQEEYDSSEHDGNIIYFISNTSPSTVDEISPNILNTDKWKCINNAVNLIQTAESLLESQS